MDRREIQRKRLANEAFLQRDLGDGTCRDIGRLSCHAPAAQPRPEREIQPGEEYSEIVLNTETGTITITGFDGNGTEIGSRQL